MNPEQQQAQVGNYIVLNMHPADGFRKPVRVLCPKCKQTALTQVTLQSGSGASTCALILFLICIPLVCCPYFFDDCSDAIQRCSFCNAFLGKDEQRFIKNFQKAKRLADEVTTDNIVYSYIYKKIKKVLYQKINQMNDQMNDQQRALMQNTIILSLFPADGEKEPVMIICPNCKQQGMTNIQLENGSGANAIACILCLLGCYLCCFFPFCMDQCKDIKQHCSYCNAFVGKYEYKGVC